MLAFNEVLPKTREKLNLQFCQVKYSSSREIFALPNEKEEPRFLITWKSKLLIWAIKSVDSEVIRVEVLEDEQYLKVHWMSLDQYFGQKKMEVLRRELELAIKIQLKTIPSWLMCENCLREQQESDTK